jgi:hypothetical protein
MGLTRPTVSQLNTVVTEISDPISVLNKGSTLANIDVGFVLNRDGGISSNAAIIWQESSDQFVLGLTSNTGAVFANIVISEFANLRVNRLTGTLATAAQPNITSVGNLTSLAASGNISTTGYLFGNGSALSGIVTSVTKIINGTSDITAYENGNIAVTVGGTSNTATFTTSGVTVSGNISASYFTGSGQFLTGINSFGNVFISGQSPVLADNTSDTLTLVSGSGIAITTDAANDSITFSSVSTTGPFAASGDFGAVNDPVTVSEDEGSVADGATITYDLGSIISASGLIYPDQLVLPSYATDSLPTAIVAAQLVYNTTTNGLAFSDGTNWSNIGASYSNVQVATYLPTYTGTVSASLINSSGNVLSTGLSVFGNTRIGSLATPGALHTIIGNVDVSGAGTEYFNIAGNILAVQGSFGSVNSTGFINTSGNVSAAVYTGGAVSVTGFINTSGNISSGGNVTVANLIVSTGAGQFSGQFNESSTTSGVFVGNASPSAPTPRVGFFNGNSTQNWQIDNNFGTFRWFTPGVVRMSLDARGNLSVFNFANINITSGSADSALQIVGNVSRGGAGYHDFLRVTSTASGATNPNKHLRLDGTGNLQIINSAYTGTILSLTDAGILSDGKGDVRAAPQNSQGGAYTLVVGDAGKHISITTGGVTVNASIFSVGDMVTVFNNSGSSQTITQGTSVTLRLAGTATTGNRTLAQYGIATLLCVTGGASPVFACTGAGLT